MGAISQQESSGLSPIGRSFWAVSAAPAPEGAPAQLIHFGPKRRDAPAQVQCFFRPRRVRIEPVEHALCLFQGGGKFGEPQASLAGPERVGRSHWPGLFGGAFPASSGADHNGCISG